MWDLRGNGRRRRLLHRPARGRNLRQRRPDAVARLRWLNCFLRCNPRPRFLVARELWKVTYSNSPIISLSFPSGHDHLVRRGIVTPFPRNCLFTPVWSFTTAVSQSIGMRLCVRDSHVKLRVIRLSHGWTWSSLADRCLPEKTNDLRRFPSQRQRKSCLF